MPPAKTVQATRIASAVVVRNAAVTQAVSLPLEPQSIEAAHLETSSVVHDPYVMPVKYRMVQKGSTGLTEYATLSDAINEARRQFFADPTMYESHVNDSDGKLCWRIEGK